jgi:hypothetical protein
MEMKRLSKDLTLFEQGDPGDNFYIIFSGKVAVFTRKPNDIADTFDYTFLTHLKEGDSFGELSLIYGAPRAATIRTVEATDLIVISKEVYDKVIKKFQVDQIIYIVDFYSNLVVFSKCEKDLIIGLATKTQVVKTKSKQIFVREGDQNNMVWFIYIGKVNIVKNVKIGKKVKNLKIDTLGRTDIFGHNSITNEI